MGFESVYVLEMGGVGDDTWAGRLIDMQYRLSLRPEELDWQGATLSSEIQPFAHYSRGAALKRVLRFRLHSFPSRQMTKTTGRQTRSGGSGIYRSLLQIGRAHV